MKPGSIVRAVRQTINLQVIAEEQKEECDFIPRWSILAFQSQVAINNHEMARYKDEAVKQRGAA